MKLSEDTSARWAIGAGAGSLAAFLVFAALLWRAGLFEFTGSEASSKVVGASVALIGGFIGSVVAFVGLILTNSIQVRAERRQQIEAVIQALGLLTTASGAQVSSVQRVGVLFALESLEMLPLALTLLENMLSTRQVDANTAAQILDRGLPDRVASVTSARILYDYAADFRTAGQYAFPHSIDMAWPTTYPELARELTALARLRLICSASRSTWDDGALSAHTASLAQTWRLERVDRIRDDAGMFLRRFIEVHEPDSTLYPPYGPLNINQLKAELDRVNWSAKIPTTLASPYIQGLDDWLTGVRAR